MFQPSAVNSENKVRVLEMMDVSGKFAAFAVGTEIVHFESNFSHLMSWRGSTGLTNNHCFFFCREEGLSSILITEKESIKSYNIRCSIIIWWRK